MSNLKRFLALTLVIVMVVAGAVPAMAATTYKDVSDTDSVKFIEGINVLSDLGIIKGTGTDEDGNALFSPEKEVTRAQMAMFVARIKSAMPWLFATADPSTPTKFADVTDATYYAAINYCVDKQIINGRDDKTFDPDGTVTLQEAAKMIVLALGYTGIDYPVGTLQKAKLLHILDDIDISSATRKLTRKDVAIIIYNMLVIGDYVDVVLGYNEQTGRMEEREKIRPVIETFGINRFYGYVVAGATFGMNYNAFDANGKIVILNGAAPGTKDGTSVLDPTKYDIQVGYVAKDNTAQYLKLQKEQLGWKDYTDEYLLGLKVLVFVPTAEAVNIKLPSSKLLGTKIMTSIENNTATMAANTDAVDNGLVVKKDADPANVTLNGVNYGKDISNVSYTGAGGTKYPRIYTWNGSTKLSAAMTLYGNDELKYEENRIDRTLAKFIQSKGAYKLDVIDNGDFANSGSANNGKKELCVVFEPYYVMEYKPEGSNVRIGLDTTQNIAPSRIKPTILKEGTTFTAAVGNYYLVSIRSDGSIRASADYQKSPITADSGNHYVMVYEQLGKVATGAKSVYAMDKTAVFQYADQTQHAFNFNMTTSGKAVGALYYAYSSTLALKFVTNSTYDLYKNSAGEVIFTKENAPASYIVKDYAYVIKAHNSTPQWSGTTLTYVQPLTIRKVGSVSDELIFISKVNGNNMGSSDVIATKDVIAYEAGLTYYSAYTLKNALDGTIPGVADTAGVKLKTGDSATGFNNKADQGFYTNTTGLAFSNANGRIDFYNGVIYSNNEKLNGVLQVATKIIIASDTPALTGEPKSASITTETLKNKILNDSANIWEILVVTDNRTAAPSLAPAVFVFAIVKDSAFVAASTDTSGISDSPYYVVSDKRTSYGLSGIFTSQGNYYDTRVAYNIKDGSAINVTTDASNVLNIGAVVRVTNDKRTGTFTYDDGTTGSFSANLAVKADGYKTYGFADFNSLIKTGSVNDINAQNLETYVRNASVIASNGDTYQATNISRVVYGTLTASLTVKKAVAISGATIGTMINAATNKATVTVNQTAIKYTESEATAEKYIGYRTGDGPYVYGTLAANAAVGDKIETFLVYVTTKTTTPTIAEQVTIIKVTIEVIAD